MKRSLRGGGEWEVNKYTSTVNGISRVFAYEVWSGNQCVVNKTEIDYPCEYLKTELLANANLIKASPKLYAMLEMLADCDENQMYKAEIKELLAEVRGE